MKQIQESWIKKYVLGQCCYSCRAFFRRTSVKPVSSFRCRLEELNNIFKAIELSNVYYMCSDLERMIVSSQGGLKAVFLVAFRNVCRYV